VERLGERRWRTEDGEPTLEIGRGLGQRGHAHQVDGTAKQEQALARRRSPGAVLRLVGHR
jgi:hypothetical protein